MADPCEKLPKIMAMMQSKFRAPAMRHGTDMTLPFKSVLSYEAIGVEFSTIPSLACNVGN